MFLDKLTTTLLNEQVTGRQPITLINFLTQAGKVRNAKALIHKLAHRVSQHEGTLMSIAPELKQQGRIQWRQEDIQARKLTRSGTNAVDRRTVMKMTGLTEDDMEHIRH